MPRNARKNLDCNIFHIIVQGINKEYIFEEDCFKNKYQEILKNSSEEHNIKLLSYCIMSNHAHILIYTDNSHNMSKYMQSVNVIFSKYYNNKKNRVGIVFRNRFKSEAIINRQYLFNCIAYIHNNPVKANMVHHPSLYKYSSYNDFCEDKISKDSLNLIFKTTTDYLEIFKKIHKENDKKIFIDFIEDIDYDKVIKELKNYNIGEILMNEQLLKQVLNNLIYENRMPISKVAEIFKLTRYKINKIIKKINC